jgi:hypothetical protein
MILPFSPRSNPFSCIISSGVSWKLKIWNSKIILFIYGLISDVVSNAGCVQKYEERCSNGLIWVLSWQVPGAKSSKIAVRIVRAS